MKITLIRTVLALAFLLTASLTALNLPVSHATIAALAAQPQSYIREFLINRTQSEPGPIAVAPNGTVWFIETNAGLLAKFDPTTNGYSEFLPNTTSFKLHPTAIQAAFSLVPDPKGNIWFSLPTINAIGCFNATDQFFSYYNLTQLNHRDANSFPMGLAVDSSGMVWFAESEASRIGRLDPFSGTSGTLQEYNLTQPNATPYQVFLDDSRNLWTTSIWYQITSGNSVSGSTLTRLNTSTGEMKSYDLSPSGIFTPVGLAVDSSGRAWIGDHAGSWILEVDTLTGRMQLHHTSLPPLVDHPQNLTDRTNVESLVSYDIVLGTDGTPWFMEHLGGRVAHFQPANNTLVEYNVPTPNPYTLWIAASRTGGIWFTEFFRNKIGYLDSTNARPPFSVSPTTLSVDIVPGESATLRLNVTNESPSPINITAGIESTNSFGSYLSNYTVQPKSITAVTVAMNSSAYLLLGNYTLGKFASFTPVIKVTDGWVNIPVTVNVVVVPASSDPYLIAGGSILIVAVLVAVILYRRRMTGLKPTVAPGLP